jgi:hypothetical protein
MMSSKPEISREGVIDLPGLERIRLYAVMGMPIPAKRASSLLISTDRPQNGYRMNR